MRKSFLIAVVLLLFAVSQGQPVVRLDGRSITIAEIDTFVTGLMERAQVEGLGLSILNNNRVVYLKSFGYRNKPAGQRLDTATIMYGASLSKAVFGFLVMTLVERNILDLDRPLYHYLRRPLFEYTYFADLKSDTRWKQITARMCLSHTTGLPNVRWLNPMTSAEDTSGVMRLYFDPGSKYAYSGEGFKLLQLVVEEITGRTVDALAVDYVFAPLGMSRTGYIWHDSFGDDNVAVGHMRDGAIDKKRKRTEAVSGGSLVTTLADYSRFTEAVMQRRGLSGDAFETMVAPQLRIYSVTQFPPITYETTTENDDILLSYALGWGYFRCPYGRAIFKEGNGGAWRNYTINYIDKGIAMIILVNSEGGERMFRPLLEKLMGDTCIPWKWEGY